MKNQKNLLYLGPEDSLATVRHELGDFEITLCLTEEAVDRVLPGSNVVLDAYMRVRFDADRLARAAELQLFVTATTGADHIDVAALGRRGVPLLTLKGQRDVLRNITPAAEHSWLLLMACARGFRTAVAEPLSGGWNRNNHPGMMLRGRTLGVIGCGRIGEWMSRYAHGFGVRCIGYDPYLDRFPETIEPVGLDQLLAESDFVSIHVHLTPETSGLIGESEIRRMKPGVILVNTARGDIVDEAALLQGLRSGHIAAAGIDVLSGEPDIVGHPLVDFARENPNLVITPHIGGFSPDALRFVLTFSCGRIREFYESGRAA
jgi:phosphoglycerate dehydrogenase-like enzyme